MPEPPTETEPVTEETLPEPPTETEPVTEVTLPEPPTGTEPVTEVTLPEPPTETAPEETEGTPGITPPQEPEKKTSGTIHPAGPILKSQLGGAGRGSSSCYHDLQERGDATSVYEVHYCPVHDLVRQAAEELLAAAVTEEEKLFAWQQIRALWQNRLNAMYDDLLAQAAKETEEEKRKEKEEIIQKEKEAFYLQLTCYEADLELLFPENQLLVAEKVADALRYRTMDLCYEMSNAPKERVDSYLKEEILFLPGEIPGEDCGYAYERLENGKVRMREFFCAEDAGIRGTMVRMTEQARDFPELFRESLASYGISPEEIGEEESLLEAAWRRSGSLWRSASDQITTKRYLEADEAGKEIILASRAAFAEYLKRREAFLTLFYEKEPETALEVLAELALRRTVQFCESLAEAGE